MSQFNVILYIQLELDKKRFVYPPQVMPVLWEHSQCIWNILLWLQQQSNSSCIVYTSLGVTLIKDWGIDEVITDEI